METRFPVSRESEHIRIGFVWYDAFRTNKRTEQFSIHFEKAAVLFNIGAVQTQLALACDRGTDQGLKDAAKRFQASALALPGCTKTPTKNFYALSRFEMPFSWPLECSTMRLYQPDQDSTCLKLV